MKIKAWGFAPIMMAAVLAVTSAAAQTVDKKAPDALVKHVVESVIASVKTDPAARGGDLGRVTQIVEQKFLPYADFEHTTRLAVGSAWKDATPAQQKQLFEQFKTLLVSIYATQLMQVRDQDVKFQYKPFNAVAGATDAVVQTHMLNNGDDMEVGYRLSKTPSGWKIYDINMLGAWLIQVYRQQFAEQIARGGIDGLVKFLTAHNARQAG